MNKFERGLKRVREHPARFILPNVMTLARPIVGYAAMQDARGGDWESAQKKFRIASATDMEGYVARPLNATSKFGAIGDPVADGIERAEGVVALAPEMNKFALVATVVFEADSLRLNSKVQKGREKPFVPKSAKAGSMIEAVGADVLMTGIVRNDKRLKAVGEAAIVAGAAMRNLGYRKEYRRMKSEDKSPIITNPLNPIRRPL